MTRDQHIIFPVKFSYNGRSFETKASKHLYRSEILYKVAMPSAVSPVQQCWLASGKKDWRLIMGNIDPMLMQQLILIIQKQEKLSGFYPEKENVTELKSA